jgi:hypothetical protein
MRVQRNPQRSWSALVKQHPHAFLPSGRRQALLSELQYGQDLFAADSREPIKKFIHCGAVLEVFEEGFHRHTSPSEYPRAAHFGDGALDSQTMTPIEHRHWTLQSTLKQARIETRRIVAREVGEANMSGLGFRVAGAGKLPATVNCPRPSPGRRGRRPNTSSGFDWRFDWDCLLSLTARQPRPPCRRQSCGCSYYAKTPLGNS